MAKFLVTKRSAIILFIAFLVATALVGILCALLPQCEIEPAEPEPQKQPWENIRLPQTVSPVSYDLLVRTDLTNFVFSGSVEILIECLEPTDLILIHGKNLTVGKERTTLKRDGGGTAPELLKEPWIYEDSQFIVIELDGTLQKGAKYRLYIEFQGPLLDDLLGYYRMSYTTTAGEKRFLASTFFDPVDARKAFPCFDEPAMKATFTITLEHEPKYHALANSPKSGDDEVLSDGWIRATFKETVIMSSYLVCYVVSDFKAKFTTTANGVKFGVWAREDFINQTDYALEKGAAVLDYFDGLYGDGVVYPMEKMDMIALPDFTAGAMENWGLITYRDTALLYEDGVSSESQKQRVCAIVAHELAHQWFGNLVTMKWWDHLWLNEGFASYIEYVGTVEVEPDWGMWDKFILYDLHRAMATDARVTSRPIINEVETPAEINSMFDRISYQKGSSVLRMMSHFLGDETFLKGLKYYLDAMQYSNAVNSDLWFHISKAMEEDNVNLGDGMDIATVMKTWMHQMGFPVIKVERDYTGNGQIMARVEQKRFLSDPTSDTTTDYPDLGYVWYVPLTYTTSSSPDFELPLTKWIRPEDEYVNLETPGSSTDWLLLNIDQRGIYRVNYDDQNWALIKDQLEADHKAISTASRAALISDAFSLAEASEISQSTAFDMTTYLKEERDFVPWYAVDGALSTTEKNLQRKGAFGNFQKYMRAQVTPMYEYVGWENTGDHLTRMSRGGAVSMACRYGNEDCIETSVNFYSQWMMNQDEILVHPDMQGTAYCSAIAAGGQDEWNFAFDVYRNLNTPSSVKARLLDAMACSKKPWILNTYLSYILDTNIIRAQDAADVITAVAGNPVGLPLAWDFFRGNWDFFRTGYGETVFLLDNIISGITSYFNTPFELESLEKFMADNPDQGTGARAFTEAVAVVKGNIRWIEQNYEDVDQWLQAAVTEPDAWMDIRLPQTLTPEHYDLMVRTDLTNFVFSGSINILIECHAKTDVILVHSRALNITKGVTTLMHASGGKAPSLSKEPWLYKENEFLVVELNSYLTAGEKYKLYLEFAGPLNADLAGYYRSTYTTKLGEKRYLASTFFDPLDARKAFPCFDEPAMKATFTITLEHEPKYHALANTPKSGDDEVLSDGWIRATFDETVKMSSYLVCYVVSDFKAKFTTTANGVTFGVWAQEDFINQTDYSLEKGAAILDYFDNLYGLDIKYPLAKLDMIALPDFAAGAMENWGLITYRESALLYEDGVSSASQKQRVCTIVAHELAHQWFGNLVTMKWWDELWLNEGFASYVEYVGTVEVEPDWEMWDKFVAYDLRSAMNTDALVTSRPVVAPATTPAEIGAMFDTVTYSKGSSVIRMMTNFLGESTFTKGIKNYLRARQYDTAENSDLWFHLQAAADEDNIDFGPGITMETIMKPWLRQMGFPVVTVTRRYTGDDKITAMASQKRFLTDPASDTSSSNYIDFGYQWYVPLTYITSASPSFTAPDYKWMSPTADVTIERDDIGGDTDWLLMNIDQQGFYRVNYDDTNWKLLSTQLVNDHQMISTASRASLIGDAFNLARAGELNQAIALELTSYLNEEREYVPWYMVDANLGYIYDNLALTDANGTFEAYMRDQIGPMYEYIGWEDEGGNLERLSRARIIRMACKYRLENCTMTAVNQYQEWAVDSSFYIQPDLQSTVLCTGIAEGDQNDWDHAFGLYTDPTTDSSLKSAIRSALSCSRDTATLSKYLNEILNTSVIRQQDGASVLGAVANNPAGRELAWDFYKSNWEYFRTAYGDSVFLYSGIIEEVTSDFNTQEKLEEVEQFIKDHPDQGTGKRAFEEAVATISANIRWMDQNLDEVTEWLENAGNDPWENIRIPNTVLPISYDLKVRTDLTNFNFNGSVRILVECFEKTNIIILHSKKLNITQGATTLMREGGGVVPGLKKEPWLYEMNEVLVIELDSMLDVGGKYYLYIEFAGLLLSDRQGYYWSVYTAKSGETRYLASTFFDPLDARKAFPCFDEPAMKATFTITLEHEPKYHALANTPKSGDDEVLSDGWIRATFDETVKMSTYLVCYVVSDFKAKYMTTEHGITFGVWAQEDFINQTDYALEKGAAILDFFDELYGMDIKYPMAKMDMIALPDFTAGAMENWGLITYRESALLYEDGVSSETQKQRVCTIVSHELAHQWFGNLVTMEWWDYLWLNEGFASYVEYVGTVEVEPDWGMWDKFLVYDLQRSMTADALVTSRPIVAKSLTVSEINAMFDRITYNKGSSVLRMLQQFLGETTFLKGLKYYLREQQYGSAENSDLWYNLDKAIKEDGIDLGEGIDIEDIMRPWTRQMGFPVVSVTRMYGDDDTMTMTASQKRFLTDPTSDPSSPFPDLGYVWHVPLTYTTEANPDYNTPGMKWLRPEDKTTKMTVVGAGGDSSWLLVNVDARGFYRVNYDEKNWGLLATQLESNHKLISTASRAALISDAFSLARAGELSQARALDLTAYLIDEREYVPWYTVDSVLGYINDNLALTAANDNFQEYMKKQVTPMYEFIGWENEGDHLKKLSRASAISLACQYGNDDCVQTAVEKYAEWMTMANSSTINIAPDLQSTVFCTGIAEGSRADWDVAFQTYINPNADTSLKSVLLPALACSQDESTLSFYLSQVLDTSVIRTQDGKDVVIRVAANSVGRTLAWDFFDDNWTFFREEYGNGVFLLENVVDGVTSKFNTPEELAKVEQFIKDHPDQGSGERAFIQSIAVINANIRWMDQYYNEVADWLENAA